MLCSLASIAFLLFVLLCTFMLVNRAERRSINRNIDESFQALALVTNEYLIVLFMAGQLAGV